MKTVTTADCRMAPWHAWARWRRAGIGVLALFLVSVAGVQAQIVDTLTGGPSQQNPNSSSGFVDGDTALLAQFNLPAGIVLDPASRFLFVADTANAAVRKLDLSGNLTTTILGSLATPVDLGMDGGTNLYILTQGDGLIRKLDTFGNLTIVNAVALVTPTALALDVSTNLYVTELGGAVKRINPTNGVVTTLIAAGTFSSPRGIEVLDNGTIVISDTGNHAIRTINPTTLAITTFAGTVGTSGTNNGTAGTALFNLPAGIAKAGNDILIVADEGNNQVRRIEANGATSLFYGVPTAVWAGLEPEFFPGWLDDEDGDSLIESESRDPEGVAVDGSGNVFVTEQFYHIIRKVTNTGLTGPSGTFGGGDGGTNVVINPPSLSITPNSGYFPMGQTITVFSSSPNVFFTVDGSEPTTNSTPVAMSGGSGTIQWFNPTNDLTFLRVASFIISGTNVVSTNIIGQAASTNSIGIPLSLNTTIFGGVGSTIVIPVVANIRTNDIVKSFQFRVEITPNGGAPMIPASFDALSVRTNDFVPIITAAQGATSAVFSVTAYTIGTTRGLLVSAIGTNSNVSFQRFAATALLRVPIPGTAVEGQTYSISVLQPSATSDGQQTSVPISASAPTTITVTNVAYLLGDTSPGRWYNAGDFGNGDLNNPDINNVFYASLGVVSPFTFTDAFDAMDVFPLDAAGSVGGDGEIRFLDLQTVLNRSVRLDTNNWIRAWSTAGAKTNGMTTLPDLPAEELQSLPGAIWVREALMGVLPVGNAQPDHIVQVPVYLKVAAGATITGLQFLGVIEPELGAPSVSSVSFVKASSIPNPSFPFSGANSSGLPGAGGVWNLGTLNLAGGTSNLLGYLQFRIPAAATVGTCYRARLLQVDGAPSLFTTYNLENVGACVSVGVPAESPSLISEQWINHFFGSSDNPLADPLGDADGDGISNYVEYLAGTNPTNALSLLQVNGTELRLNGENREAVVELLTAPGKTYVLESTTDLSSGNWTVVATIVGDGTLKEFVQANAAGGSLFYRVRLLP
ncbi:MAG: chitobiase/beta-hexosaminidase C-terminal domain-containing protein [Verrucomicrobiota bacterium]